MELFQKIENISLLEPAGHFELFQAIANAVNSTDSSVQNDGRNHLIKVIDVWEQIPTGMKPMWEDLIESVGFYPYIEKYKMTVSDLDARIRQEYHRSNYIFDKTLHSKQKELSDLVLSKRNVIVSAPTSFGKSLLIEEIVASGIYTNIVIIQPTLALLDETRIKLRQYADQYKIIVRTSQEPTKEKGNIFLLTAERVLEYPELPDIDLLIIDEFYKLSKQREDNRANILNIAFLRLTKNPNCRFYLLGPNIDNVSTGFREKYNAVFFKTDYSLVYTETDNRYDSVKKKQGGKVADEDIFTVLDGTDDQSLIFCSSPSTARKLAFAYCKHLEDKGVQKNADVPLIQWIHENLSVEWSLAHCLSNEIGVHDGSMPKHITTATIKYFNDRKLKFLFCTNTIIEGVNTSAKNVIYYDDKIGTRDVDYFDYANIRGRAGRLMEHCVGKVINLKQPPEPNQLVVDIPAYTQNPIDDEVLVNIEKEEVKPFNRERYQQFESLPEDLQTILKRNAVSIRDQLELIPIIREMMLDPKKHDDIVWGAPRDKKLYYHLYAIFDLVKERFVEGNDKNTLISTKWMASQTTSYLYSNKNLRKLVDDRISYLAITFLKKDNPNFIDAQFDLQRFVQDYPDVARRFADEAIETVFKFQKNWLQYKIPKWLNVVDSLQKYVAKDLGIQSGDYSYYAESIENEFADANIRILTEYGVPSSAIQKILDRYGRHLKNLNEDQVVAAIIRNRELINRCLSQYEIEALNRCL
jgi:superfamily II DNA/RNA helicase